MMFRYVALGLVPLVLAACSSDDAPSSSATGLTNGSDAAFAAQPIERWYASQQVSKGAVVFQQNCAACHGQQAEGAPNWQKLGPDGKYPAPPLNGSGHGWHHPLRILFQVIKNGSPGGQGNMPPWKDKLGEDEMVAVIAWFQSQWPEEIYAAWMQRELASHDQGG